MLDKIKRGNMKRFIVCIVAIFAVLATVCLCVGAGFEYQRIDSVYINEVLQGLDSSRQPEEKVYDYTLFRSEEHTSELQSQR